jgi:hypothetical protein
MGDDVEINEEIEQQLQSSIHDGNHVDPSLRDLNTLLIQGKVTFTKL